MVQQSVQLASVQRTAQQSAQQLAQQLSATVRVLQEDFLRQQATLLPSAPDLSTGSPKMFVHMCLHACTYTCMDTWSYTHDDSVIADLRDVYAAYVQAYKVSATSVQQSEQQSAQQWMQQFASHQCGHAWLRTSVVAERETSDRIASSCMTMCADM